MSEASGSTLGGGPVRLILASASPARRATLAAAGIEATVIVSQVDEEAVIAGHRHHVHAPSPWEVARILAEAKAADVAGGPAIGAKDVVLGCDSVLELDGAALGKPGSPQAAVERWRAMRGRSGVLHTGHTVVHGGRTVAAVGSTTVWFADLSDAEIEAYVATGEPLWVAGAFTIDGYGGPFVERIDGDHHNVVGLSLPLLRRLLGELGIGWFDLPRLPAG